MTPSTKNTWKFTTPAAVPGTNLARCMWKLSKEVELRAHLSTGTCIRARARRRCTIVRRDKCHVANADNAHLTTSNSILCSVLCVRFCAYARRRLLCSELCRHNVRLPTGHTPHVMSIHIPAGMLASRARVPAVNYV